MFLLGTIHAPSLYRTSKDFPPLGTRRHSAADIVDLTLETARASSILVRTEGMVPQQVLNIWTRGGQIAFARNERDPGRWTFHPRAIGRRTPAVCEKELRDAIAPALLALPGLCLQLPEDHLPGQPLEGLTPQERELIEAELAPAAEWSEEAGQQFGGCLAAMADGLARARDADRRTLETLALNKRLRRQFGLLPEGTILIDRGGHGHAAVVSSERGRRTRRSLVLRRGEGAGGSERLDISQDIRQAFALVTQDRPRTLRPGILSAHEIITALGQAQGLAATCPDLL